MDDVNNAQESPFFSIILPTKNRSHLVAYAVESVIDQDFDSFELIVCDNDDDDEATRVAISSYLANGKVIYFRTGGLDMVANWNSALQVARGRYLIVLEDKMAFYKNALVRIQNKLLKVESGVVVWHTDNLDENRGVMKLKKIVPSEDKVLNSGQVLELVAEDVMRYWALLPRALSCVVPMQLVRDWEGRTQTPFYEIKSPDFVCAIKTLANVDSYLMVNSAYTFLTSMSHGNGQMALARKADPTKYYGGKNGFKFELKMVPVPEILCVANSVIDDFNLLKNKYGGKLVNYHVTSENYVIMLFKEFFQSTLARRRIVWSWREIHSLFRSGRGVFWNVFGLAFYFRKFLLNKIFQRPRFEGMQVRYESIIISGGAPDVIRGLMGRQIADNGSDL